jgi:hypothetical protein
VDIEEEMAFGGEKRCEMDLSLENAALGRSELWGRRALRQAFVHNRVKSDAASEKSIEYLVWRTICHN